MTCHRVRMTKVHALVYLRVFQIDKEPRVIGFVYRPKKRIEWLFNIFKLKYASSLTQLIST